MEAGDHGRGKIMVVEDNPFNMELVSDLLKFHGYTVFEAVDEQACTAWLQKELPDLILMDIQLPGTDGYQLIHALRSNPRYTGIRIVALTAFAMQGDREKAMKQGFIGVITKPIDTRMFPEMIEFYLAMKI